MPRNHITHGEYIGGKPSHEYAAYIQARRRCVNKDDPAYYKYGGRGIKFLYTSWEQFIAELGRCPVGKSLDRINNNGNYEPGNCRWATRSEQCYNRTLGYKIMPNDARQIHNLVKWGMKRKDVATLYNIHQCHVSRILNGTRRPLSHIFPALS